jgi:CBS domain-containing protein
MIWTVGEIMTPDPVVVGEADTVRRAAELMADQDIGFLPVCRPSGEVVGVVTDRDIVLRVAARAYGSTEAAIGSICGRRPATVEADDLVEEALLVMISRQVRRLPVVRRRRLVGVLGFADVALSADPVYVGEALRGICKTPGRTRRVEPE